MRKNIIYILATLLCIGVALVFVMIITKKSDQPQAIENVRSVGSYDVMGAHCTYTVGCSCSGFTPKNSGDVWEKSYCKRCGHHKKYHK